MATRSSKPDENLPQKEQSLEELIREGQLLHTLIDNMPDHIYIKDLDSKFLLVNQTLIKTHGLNSAGDMIGKSDHDFYPGELADKYYSNEQEIIKSGKPLIGIEEKALNDKGEEIYLSTTKIPFRDQDGKVIGIVGIGRDITLRRMAEQKLQMHAEDLQIINALLEEKQEEIQQQSEELTVQAEHLHEAITESQKLAVAVSETENVVVILDARGDFEWVNQSFTRVYGRTMEEFTAERGKNLIEVSHNPRISEILEQCKGTGKTVSYESEATDSEGNTIWVQSTLTPVFDEPGNIVQFVAIDADVTALKTAQELIRKQKDELELRGQQLETANNTKDKFFSIIAHDLKNPFHSILGFSELISRDYGSIPDDKKREFLGLIHESSQYANALLDNLLNWSRTQQDRITYSPAPMELRSSVEELRHMFHSSLEKKKISFMNNIPENTVALADPNMIQTVIRNLVYNAIKFTPESGHIEIGAERSGKRLIIKVRDNGIGISRENQEKLFEFGEFMSSAGTGGEQGTGLGLLICHEFVKKHDGRLEVESEPGKGSTFFFDIQLPDQGLSNEED